jgi:hypothetical protein
MVESFDSTRKFSELKIYVSTDDPKLNEYKLLPKSTIDRIIFGSHKWMPEVLNFYSTELIKDADFYTEVNDDHIYHTKDWDETLANLIIKNKGWGIAAPNDTIDPDFKDENPSAYMLSGNIVRTLGYFIFPAFRHVGSDSFTRYIGKTLNILYHDKNVVIEHRCWHDTTHGIGSRAPKDANVEFVYGKDEERFFANAWQVWLRSRDNEVNKIRIAMDLDLKKSK